MTNIEKKYELWEQIKSDYNFDGVTTTLEGIENDDIYFHPIFQFNDGSFVRCQCDIGNSMPYAFRFVPKGMNSIEIPEHLVKYLVLAYLEDTPNILFVLETMQRVTRHIDVIHELANDYFAEALQFNSLKAIEQELITEIKVVTALAEKLHINTRSKL